MFEQLAKAFLGSSSSYSSNAQSGNGSTTREDPKAKGTTAAPSVLREDLYKAIQECSRWLATSTPGDGFAYRPVLEILKPHYPDLEVPFGIAQEEIAIIVGAVTNLAFEYTGCAPESYTAIIAFRTWIDTLDNAIRTWRSKGESAASTANRICDGVVQGVNVAADPSFITKEFTGRLQVINMCKTISVSAYGANSSQTRQSDALWGSRLLSS
ncbi:uncharacterized protein EI90DRAFT_3057523 [Cantharellus anzutake]|uniref:uncharacterized protein n=1 Tax=Cantharellus anzutake TaxID=1750568 RepID=UPI0019068F61|nr:uncharacterized protein EI90DRAFT_3057523 [Cantharellus anzutake]KAF8331321.1 hypothetical protein EI90DRAFT_3057523 [Cantharellus anzutake]